jgi:hypothetical protein
MDELPPFELGYARTELRRKLVDAVLSGDKTATLGFGQTSRRTRTSRCPRSACGSRCSSSTTRFRVVERLT